MRLLHTADWHLGRSLFGRNRYDEFEKFLDWLANAIKTEAIDALLVAGDIFDTTTPSNRAMRLYYQFLYRVTKSRCRHIVITAGNHDSPSLLTAPKQLLLAMNIHVVGAISDSPADEVIILRADDGAPEAIVCATPYLRDKDIRATAPGETIDEKNAKIVAGIRAHYEAVCLEAENLRDELSTAGAPPIPIIAMGHLFAAGGKTAEGDGVRELYVGSLSHVGKDIFPQSIDYLALGHLHSPQTVGGAENIRYCGSPIPMGYGDARQEKKVVRVEFAAGAPLDIRELPIPCFQRLIRIEGSLDVILTRLKELRSEQSDAWVEIEYTGSDIVGDLSKTIDDAVAGSSLEIRRIQNRAAMERIAASMSQDTSLQDLSEENIFERCLDHHGITDETRKDLLLLYQEILRSLKEEDVNAE